MTSCHSASSASRSAPDSALGGERFDPAEAALELGVCVPQRHFRVDVELAGEVGGGKEQITHLVFDPPTIRTAIELGLEFGNFFGKLGEDRARLRPIEADPRRAALKLDGPHQRRQRRCDPVEDAHRRSGAPRLLAPLGRFMPLPGLGLRLGRGDLCVAKDMRVAALHLVRDRRGNVFEPKRLLLFGHAGMEHHLEKKIAELVL